VGTKMEIQVELKQQGKGSFLKPQIVIDFNFTKEHQPLDKLYAINILPFDDDCEIELSIWQYKEHVPVMKYLVKLTPEKIHGIFQLFTLYGGEGLKRDPLHVVDSFNGSLRALEEIAVWKVKQLLADIEGDE
jgi:hypothetical protein